MRRLALVSALLVLVVSFSGAQQWTTVWKQTSVPYLTLQDITEMGTVKAGFDTDKDGWGEILCTWTDLDTNAILMYEADANNSYKLVWYWRFPVDANSFAGIAVGDLNNNGIVDIVTALPSVVGTDPNPPRVWVFEWNNVVGQNSYGFLNSSTGLYEPSSAWNFDAAANYDLRPYSLTIEDIDNDGKNELITGVRLAGASNREAIVSTVEGDYGGFVVWSNEWKHSESNPGDGYCTTTGDLDNDGKREIYMFLWDLFTLRIFECTGSGQFTQAFAVDQLYASQSLDYGGVDAVRVADVNNDGVNEMYLVGTDPKNQVFIVTGVTDVSKMTSADIKELCTLPVTPNTGPRTMYVADPDKDGKTNLMIAGDRYGQIYSLEYKGTGNPADSASWDFSIVFDMFKESGLTTIGPRLFYGYPAKDMDKDGKDEFVFVNYSPDFDVWPGDSPLWVIEIDVASDVRDQPAEVPTDIQLLQNYPNPFNPSTTIPYKLSSRSRVLMDVFDVYGQHVATLVNAEREAGYYHARWIATVPSGTYFCRLMVEPLDGSGSPFKDVKKMMLVR